MTEGKMLAEGRCSECVIEYGDGKRDRSEVNMGEGECSLCGFPACESHAKTYDTNVVSGWTHETCKENWREF